MLKKQVEAILFAKGKKVSLEELKKLLNIEDGRQIRKSVTELSKDYEKRDTAIQVQMFTDGFKLSVSQEYIDLVRNIMPETEISRGVLETLSIIAWKYPDITQSEIVNIRGSNSYEHLKELEKIGFIKREEFGRTKKISLTQKFFNYFDVDDLENFQKDLSQYKEFEEAFNAKKEEVKEEEEKIKAYNKLVKKIIHEEQKKVEDLERGDLDEVLEKEEQARGGIQTTISESEHLDKDFFSKKINDELDKEFAELKKDESELKEDLDELNDLESKESNSDNLDENNQDNNSKKDEESTEGTKK